MPKPLSYIVSRVFDPLVEAPLILILLGFLAPAGLARIEFLVFSLFWLYALPVGLFVFFRQTGRIKDLDITRRRERYLFFSLIFLDICIFLAGLKIFWGGSVFAFYLNYCLPLLVFYLITFFWKISGHLMINSFLTLLLFQAAGRPWAIFLGTGICLLVGWARISQRKHDFWQVVGGAVLPWVTKITQFLFSASLPS